MEYVDGMVLAVENDKKADYIEHSRVVGGMFKEYGALSVVECWGDDVPVGEVTSFYRAVNCEDNETVCFSWIVWPSKKIRDKALNQVREDPRMDPKNTPVPFDGKRMIFGGFEVVASA